MKSKNAWTAERRRCRLWGGVRGPGPRRGAPPEAAATSSPSAKSLPRLSAVLARSLITVPYLAEPGFVRKTDTTTGGGGAPKVRPTPTVTFLDGDLRPGARRWGSRTGAAQRVAGAAARPARPCGRWLRAGSVRS